MVYELGYTFYPGRRPSEPGFSRLDIVLSAIPSEQHFDPRFVRLSVSSRLFGIETLRIRYGWKSSNHYQVLAGQIHIEDKIGKTVEVFTYGGDLDVDASDLKSTHLKITSPAPIMGDFREHSAARIIAEESEILLAERRSAWEGKEEEYEERLANTDPRLLYYTCLISLQERIKRIHMGNPDEIQHVLGVIEEELQQNEAAMRSGGGVALVDIEEVL
jgi:hypothetical protein